MFCVSLQKTESSICVGGPVERLHAGCELNTFQNVLRSVCPFYSGTVSEWRHECRLMSLRLSEECVFV